MIKSKINEQKPPVAPVQLKNLELKDLASLSGKKGKAKSVKPNTTMAEDYEIEL